MKKFNILLIDENFNIGGGVRTILDSLIENSKFINYYYWNLSKKDYKMEDIKLTTIHSVLAKFTYTKYMKIIIPFYTIFNFFKLKDKIDLIYVHQPYSLFLGFVISKIYNKKLVYHCHGLSGEAQYNKLNILYKYFIKNVENIIVISKYVENQIVCVNQKAYIQLIYNGLHVNRDNKITKIEKEYDFIFVGRINRFKDPYSFINVLQKNNNFSKAILVGKIESESYFFDLKNIIDTDERFEYLGTQEYKSTQKLIAKSKYIIVPSNWGEPFGMVVLEAFKNRTLVIARRDGGLSEIIKNGYDGFLYDSNEELLSILNDLEKATYDNIVNNAYEKLIHKYSNQNIKLENKLYEIMSGAYNE
jgi:glycosyltransferase involved in cell wall biosynthesis